MNVTIYPSVPLSAYVQAHGKELAFGTKDQIPEQKQEIALKRNENSLLSRTIKKIEKINFPGSGFLKILFAGALAISVVGIPALIFWKKDHDLMKVDLKTKETAQSILNLQNTQWNAKASLIQALGIQDFQNCPVLDLGERKGPTDYINFLKPEDLTAPIMKSVDLFNRPVIALKLLDTTNNFTWVIALFQRHTDDSSWTWGSSVQWPDLGLSNKGLDNSPDSLNMLKEIIQGRNSRYKLAN